MAGPVVYGGAYRRARAALLADSPPCVWCGMPATTADHVPPVASMPSGEWTGRLVAACRRCNLGHRSSRPAGRRRGDSTPPRRRRVLR